MLRIRFREMKEEDLREVLRIERLSFPTPWSYSLFKQEMLNILSGTMVAEAENENGQPSTVGYTCFWRIGDEIHITNIAIDPPYRRNGIGERMLREIMEMGQEEGMRLMTLEVRATNTPAQHMYRKLGFIPVGVRKGYYADNGEDAIIMTLEALN